MTDLQDHESRAQTLRQNLSAARTGSDKKGAIGGLHPPPAAAVLAAAGAPKPTATPAAAAAAAKKGLDDKKASPPAAGAGPPPLVTIPLTRAAAVGDTRLHVAASDGCKKGMYVVVGTGTDVELRRIAGFGSIIVDQPLERAHPVGAPLRVYAATPKSLPAVHRLVNTEFVRGLLDEVAAGAAAEGARKGADGEVGDAYRRRAMLQHCYTVDRGAAIPMHATECRSLVASPTSGRVYGALDNGALTAIDFSLSMVELLAVFEELAAAWGRETALGGGADGACGAAALVARVERDPALRGAMQHLAEARQAPSFAALVARHATPPTAPTAPTAAAAGEPPTQQPTVLTWAAYYQLLRPAAAAVAAATQTTDVATAAAAAATAKITSQDTDNLQSKYPQLDARTVALLGRLFVLLDTDGDEGMTVADAQAACADLDGCCVDPEPFARVVARVVGSYSEDLKLNASSFVAVRAAYAESVDTMAGGLRLHGRLRLAEALAALDGARKTSDGDGEDAGADRLYATTDVASHLPEAFLLATVLPARRRASAVLRDMFSPATADQLAHALTGRACLAGAPQRAEALAGWAGRVDVAHVVAAPAGRVLYVLDRQVRLWPA